MALTVVAAERTVAAVPASAEAVRTAIGRDNPSGRGRPSGDAIHRAVAVAFVPAVETVESVAAMASVAIIAKRYEYVNQRCWPTGNRAYHRQHYPSTNMS